MHECKRSQCAVWVENCELLSEGKIQELNIDGHFFFSKLSKDHRGYILCDQASRSSLSIGDAIQREPAALRIHKLSTWAAQFMLSIVQQLQCILHHHLVSAKHLAWQCRTRHKCVVCNAQCRSSCSTSYQLGTHVALWVVRSALVNQRCVSEVNNLQQIIDFKSSIILVLVLISQHNLAITH